jgi:hypothetical protein
MLTLVQQEASSEILRDGQLWLGKLVKLIVLE